MPATVPVVCVDLLVVLQCRDILVAALSELLALLVDMTLSSLVACGVLLFILFKLVPLVFVFLL